MTGNKESNIWGDDQLGRKVEADFLENFLTGVVETRKNAGEIGSFVLNINSSWGGGKTFFLERFGKQLEENGYMVCHINAWVSDYSDDPLIPVMSAIDKSLDKLLPGGTNDSPILKNIRENFVQLTGAVVRGVAKKILTKVVADGADEFLELVQGRGLTTDTADGTEQDNIAEEMIDEAIATSVNTLDGVAKKLIRKFQETDNSLKAFKKGLGEAVVAASNDDSIKQSSFFILVDELDRCRPDYAIAMLERIKHLFEVENVIFVLATDTAQLQHSIRAVYGSEFDSQRYLHRFFDQTYALSLPTTRGIIDQRVDNSGWDVSKFSTLNNDLNSTIEIIFLAFSVNPRDANFILDTVNNIYSTLYGSTVGINIYYALTLILAQRGGIDLGTDDNPTINFVIEKCKSTAKIYLNTGHDQVEMSLKEFLLKIIDASLASNANVTRDVNASEQNNFFNWIFQTEIQMWRRGVEPKFYTREYASLIANCGRLSS